MKMNCDQVGKHNQRQEFLDGLNNFVSSSKKQIESVITLLNWKKESFISDSNVVMKNKNGETIKPMGQNLSSKKFFEGPTSPTDQLPNSTKNLAELSTSIGVSSEEDLISKCETSEEMYNALPKITHETVKLSRIESMKLSAQALTDVLKLERDAKRRRVSYKNKVHTKNKSHMQILREVVEEQMSVLRGEGEMGSEAVSLKQKNPNEKAKDELQELKLETHKNPHLNWISAGRCELEQSYSEASACVRVEGGKRERRGGNKEETISAKHTDRKSQKHQTSSKASKRSDGEKKSKKRDSSRSPHHKRRATSKSSHESKKKHKHRKH